MAKNEFTPIGDSYKYSSDGTLYYVEGKEDKVFGQYKLFCSVESCKFSDSSDERWQGKSQQFYISVAEITASCTGSQQCEYR